MGNWTKHPKKDLEQVLELADKAGWQINRGKGYYKLYCPCRMHKTTLHLSPSDVNYKRNKIAWLRRQTCWKEPN